jgi:hypothetical protein
MADSEKAEHAERDGVEMIGYLYHVCAQSANIGGGYTICDVFVTRSKSFSPDAKDQADFREWFSKKHLQGRSTVFNSITYLGEVNVDESEWDDL